MTKKNGWGLIGTGRIADDRILPGINDYSGNKLVGIKGTLAGLAIAFLLSVLIARPCQKVANTQT